MKIENELAFQKFVRYVVRKKMVEKSISAPQLAKKMNVDTVALRAKIQRGAFTAAFLFRVLKALEVESLDILAIEKEYESNEG